MHPVRIGRRIIWRMRASYPFHRALLRAAGVAATSAVTAMPAVAGGSYYRGYAYTLGDHRLVYQESHWLYDENGIGRRLVIYSCADGQPFARKWVNTAPGTATPDVDLLDARTGYREGVRSHAGLREVFSQASSSAPEQHAPIPSPPNAVIDAGFDAFVREHWDLLSAPGVAPLPFLIPSQLKFVDFSAKKLRDEHTDGRDVRWFRLQLNGWYAFVLPHIDVAYDLQNHDLFEYRGLSNIRGDGNRNLTVTIQFPPGERRADVVQADVQRAAGMPLTGRCASS
jgi:hypothetical protein